jgi:hypothetical protein
MNDVFTKYILISNRFNYKAVQSIAAEGGCKRGVGRGEAARGRRGGGSSAAWLAEYLRTCLGGVLHRDETKGGGNT